MNINSRLYCDNCAENDVRESTIVAGIIYHFCNQCFTEFKNVLSDGRTNALNKLLKEKNAKDL